MTDPAFVALSLLPIHLWRHIGERLRAGDAPSGALGSIVTAQWPDDLQKRSALLADAAVAIARGGACGLGSISWSDPDYPPSLSAIREPPGGGGTAAPHVLRIVPAPRDHLFG